jgi:hypothetical protein
MGNIDRHQRREHRIHQSHALGHRFLHEDGIYPTTDCCQYRTVPRKSDFGGRGDEFGRALGEYKEWVKATAPTVQLGCPLCGAWGTGDLFTWEHAPQQAGQSMFGAWQTGCWTCAECNNGAGTDFEGHIPDQKPIVPSSGFGLIPVSAERMLTEVKTAVVIAFNTLGYWWAWAPATLAVRDALRTRDADALFGRTWLTPAATGTGAEPGVIWEPGPTGSVTVYNGHGTAVILPNDTNPYPPPPLGQVTRGRRFGWPVLRQCGVAAVQSSCAAGELFHLDFCMKEPHWRTLLPTSTE